MDIEQSDPTTLFPDGYSALDNADELELSYELVIRDAQMGNEIYTHEYPSEDLMIEGLRKADQSIKKYNQARLDHDPSEL